MFYFLSLFLLAFRRLFRFGFLVLRLGQIIASLSCVVGGFNSIITVLGTLLDAGCWARGD